MSYNRTTDGEAERLSAWERLTEADQAGSEWPYVQVLLSLLWEHRRHIAMIYGYGAAFFCLIYAASPDLGHKWHGYPLGLGLLVLTAILSNHDNVWRYQRLRTPAQRRRACVVIVALMVLGTFILPGGS